jgi:hypothetical protein
MQTSPLAGPLSDDGRSDAGVGFVREPLDRRILFILVHVHGWRIQVERFGFL